MPIKSFLTVNEKNSFLEAELSSDKTISNSKRDRIKMLLLLRNTDGFYKSNLAKKLKTKNGKTRDRETITIWIKKYEKGGFKELMATNYEARSTVITKTHKAEIYRLIFNSDNYYESIINFIDDFNIDCNPEIKENTFRKYIKRLVSAKEFNTLMATRKEKIRSVGVNDFIEYWGKIYLGKLRRE